MRRGIFTLLSIIASGSLFPAEIPSRKPRYALEGGPPDWALLIYRQQLAEHSAEYLQQLDTPRVQPPSWKRRYALEAPPWGSPIYRQQLADYRQQLVERRISFERTRQARLELRPHRHAIGIMKEGQVLLLNIAPTGFYNNVMQELAQKKNNGLQRIHTIDTWRFLDPKTGKQLLKPREYRDELQKFINELVKPPFNKDEFGFAKPIYRDYVLYLPPIHFLIGKNGKVLDRWSSRKERLTVEDIIKRVNKVAPKLKGG